MHSTISPRQLARAIGASESSVKRWCDRGILPIVKTAGGHRRISLPEVLAFLEKGKHPLLRPEELGLPAGVGNGQESTGKLRQLFESALRSGDLNVCLRLATEFKIAGKSLVWICDDLIASCLKRIGDGWCQGTVQVFEERRGCEIVVTLLVELRRWLPVVPPRAPIALGCALEGDHYALPTRMVELVLRDAGWNAMSLGCGLPIEALRAAVALHRPRLVWISASHIPSIPEFLQEYEVLARDLEGMGTALAVGGHALTADIRKCMRYSLYGDNLQHLICFVKELERERSRTQESDRVTTQEC